MCGLRGLDFSKGGADLTFQCNKNELRELPNYTGIILHSTIRNPARALSPHSRACWSSVQDPRPIILVPLAACGKARLECQWTKEKLCLFLISLYLFGLHVICWGDTF